MDYNKNLSKWLHRIRGRSYHLPMAEHIQPVVSVDDFQPVAWPEVPIICFCAATISPVAGDYGGIRLFARDSPVAVMSVCPSVSGGTSCQAGVGHTDSDFDLDAAENDFSPQLQCPTAAQCGYTVRSDLKYGRANASPIGGYLLMGSDVVYRTSNWPLVVQPGDFFWVCANTPAVQVVVNLVYQVFPTPSEPPWSI